MPECYNQPVKELVRSAVHAFLCQQMFLAYSYIWGSVISLMRTSRHQIGADVLSGSWIKVHCTPEYCACLGQYNHKPERTIFSNFRAFNLSGT